MNLWTKIKWGFGALVSLIMAGLYIRGESREKQRDEARRKAESAQRSEQATQAKSDKDASIRKAGANARQEAAQEAQKRNEQSIKDRRNNGGSFGDHSRLRK